MNIKLLAVILITLLLTWVVVLSKGMMLRFLLPMLVGGFVIYLVVVLCASLGKKNE